MQRSQNCRLAAWLVALMALLIPGQIHCQTGSQKENNVEILCQTSPADIKKVQVPLQPLRSATGPAVLATAPPMEHACYACPYANPQQNSRCVGLPSNGPWRIRWQSRLAEGFEPRFVLIDDERVVVQAGTWQLFDLQGKALAGARIGPGQMAVDSTSGLFYSVNINGDVVAHELADGQVKFILLPTGADSFARPLIVPWGQRLFVSGFELPSGDHVPDTAAVEVINLGSPLVIESQLLVSAVTEKTLHLKTATLTVAANGQTIVFAVPDAICFADRSLEITAAYGAQFKPLAMSLDEASRAYLIVETGGRRALWLVTPKGERVFAFALPPSEEPFPRPPVVGYNHRTFIAAGGTLLAISQDGKELWKRQLSGSRVGMIVTPNGDLLVSDGPELAVYNKDGERKRLYEFAGQELCTPPVLTADGELLVASKENLYCLTPQPAK